MTFYLILGANVYEFAVTIILPSYETSPLKGHAGIESKSDIHNKNTNKNSII